MKKLMGLLILGFGFVLFLGNPSQAASAARGAKGSFALNYTTTVSTVSTGPGVVYGIVLSSGAASEYVVLFDTAPVVGNALSATLTTTAANLKTRALYGSTTANTTITYDPPLQFRNGIIAVDSASTGQALIIWESGHVTQGY